MKISISTWRKSITGIAGALLLALSVATAPAQAAPLNLVLNSYPDFRADYIGFSHATTAGVTSFTGEYGFVTHVKDLFGVDNDIFETFYLTGTMDAAFNLLDGSFAITPFGGSDPLGPKTYSLTGDLTEMGFNPGLEAGKPGSLEFKFKATGGDADLVGAYGNNGGIIISELTFDGDFFIADMAQADIGVLPAPVPEPSTIALLALGGALIAIRRRKTAA